MVKVCLVIPIPTEFLFIFENEKVDDAVQFLSRRELHIAGRYLREKFPDRDFGYEIVGAGDDVVISATNAECLPVLM